LDETEVPYDDRNHSACLKILNDFVSQNDLTVADTKYYQRGAREFAVSMLLTELFERTTVYSGASCLVDASGETTLLVRGPTVEKVTFAQVRRW